MGPCDRIGPNRELIDLGIGDVVGGVETDDGRDDGPGTEEPGGEGGGFGTGLDVDFSRVLCC